MRMIEKVARDLCWADGKDPDAIYTLGTCAGGFSVPNWELHYPFMAIRAIEAMREPNDDMRQNAQPMYDDPCSVSGIWETMIDTALSEVKNEDD